MRTNSKRKYRSWLPEEGKWFSYSKSEASYILKRCKTLQHRIFDSKFYNCSSYGIISMVDQLGPNLFTVTTVDAVKSVKRRDFIGDIDELISNFEDVFKATRVQPFTQGIYR